MSWNTCTPAKRHHVYACTLGTHLLHTNVCILAHAHTHTHSDNISTNFVGFGEEETSQLVQLLSNYSSELDDPVQHILLARQTTIMYVSMEVWELK